MFEMKVAPEPHDQRVDLDGDYAASANAEGGGNVVAHPRAKHKHAVWTWVKSIWQIVRIQLHWGFAEEFRMNRDKGPREIDDVLIPVPLVLSSKRQSPLPFAPA